MTEVMTLLELDGTAQTFSGHKTFGDVTQEIRQSLAPHRVITEIFIDDRPLSLLEEERLNHCVLKDMGRIVFKTRFIHELFRESLKMAPKICEAILHDCEEIDQLFSMNDLQKAQEHIGDMMALLEWLFQLVTGIETLGKIPLNQMIMEGESILQIVNRMNAILEQMYTALNEQKFDPFRKIMKKEFFHEMNHWKELFKEASVTWLPRLSIRES